MKYLHIQQKANESDMDYLGRLDNYASQIEGTLKNSQWAVPGHPDQITFENFGRILMRAKIISKCKGNLPEKL